MILSRDPNLARQHPADYRARRGNHDQAGAGHGKKVSARGFKRRPGHRHRRGHHGQHAVAGGRATASRWPSNADSPRIPRRWPGCGRTTPAWPRPARSPRWRRKIRPQYLAKCGGTYSSEWFFSKILHCLRTSPGGVRRRALLGGMRRLGSRGAHRHAKRPDKLIAGVCAAGHKAMCNANWGGYPDAGVPVAARSEAGRTARPPHVARPHH